MLRGSREFGGGNNIQNQVTFQKSFGCTSFEVFHTSRIALAARIGKKRLSFPVKTIITM